jgi:enolase
VDLTAYLEDYLPQRVYFNKNELKWLITGSCLVFKNRDLFFSFKLNLLEGGMKRIFSSKLPDKLVKHVNTQRAGKYYGQAFLQEGWVIANHVLVSFHVAFISSVLSLPSISMIKSDVLRFIFASPETIISAMFMYISFHTCIAVHELGHYLKAARLNALNEISQLKAARVLEGSLVRRITGLIRIFILAPYGKASGIKRQGLNYYPDAPYNLAVSAAGPEISRNLAFITLIPAVSLLSFGMAAKAVWAVYIGRLCLGVGIVGLLDFLLADSGKYREFKQRELRAREKALQVEASSKWWEMAAENKRKMLTKRAQSLTHSGLGLVTAPWQYRNCGMGGRHTEKEYPESNISMQEAMFLILGAHDYQEAQEMTVRLQNRLKEIIENEEGCRVMGIGLEGGLAPYIDSGEYPLPEVRLWALMKQTIKECGYRPGNDVAIALDPAMSELEIAYRKNFNVPDSVGMYMFWREKTQKVLDRDGVLDLYIKAVKEYDIPILSIEDGFSENDYQGWRKLLDALGDRIFIIGDDLVTTNDRTIEMAAAKGLINTVLIKANQIGTLYETILAMLVSLGKGLEIVVSHRSKSPNDDMEAQIALAVNSLGLKAGGGSNTERLIKYHAVTQIMQRGMETAVFAQTKLCPDAVVQRVFSYEEPTNAGVPSVGTTVELELRGQGVLLKFKGATPLGTSAGAGEAIHLVDSIIEASEHQEVMEQYTQFFRQVEPRVFVFDQGITEKQIRKTGDEDLLNLFIRSQRYEGKGCLNAVDNVTQIIAPVFEKKGLSLLNLKKIDQILLSLEAQVAVRRKKLRADASIDERIRVMQRKQNLGMNAVLSVSLALARAVGHLQGKSLFEIIREELMVVIEDLARARKVKIEGSSLEDYVFALQKVNQELEAEGVSLYQALRHLTRIYEFSGLEIAAWSEQDKSGQARTEMVKEQEDSEKKEIFYPAQTEQNESLLPFTLTDEEKMQISLLNQDLYRVYSKEAEDWERQQVLRGYILIKHRVTDRSVQFGLVNNRIYSGSNGMLIPYILGNTIFLYLISEDLQENALIRTVRAGIIITDELLNELAGFKGEPIDLEYELFELNQDRCEPVRIVYVRDIAELLQKISKSANESDAMYYLRILVARLSLFSLKKFLSAKNLKAEVANLVSELMNFLNEPISFRLPFLVRILVRNITGVVTKPKIIDRLWNDTIDLAEVHLRGSDIVNEIRRSTHHAVGKRTLSLVRSYLEYLETGNTESLAGTGYPEPGSADREARHKDLPIKIVARIRDDLEELLGNTDVLGRISEWKTRYEAILVGCQSGRSLSQEVDIVITDCMGKRNRWTFYHHLRIIKKRVEQFSGLESRIHAEECLSWLLNLNFANPEFDPKKIGDTLKQCIDEFIASVRQGHQEEIFERLEKVSALFQKKAYYDTFISNCELRKHIRLGLNKQAFPEQRLLLFELDCILEEMGYVALRHIASQDEEKGVDFSRCLQVIRNCALNLTHDGLYSRQLLDLAGMLGDGSYSYAEIRDVLHQIQRNYQQILRQLITPFERMKNRLELDQEELRIALANMQRFLHDLNSMVFFADSAISHIKQNILNMHEQADFSLVSGSVVNTSSGIVHLSHRRDVRTLVHGGKPVSNMLSAYGGKGSGLIYINYLNIPTTEGFIMPTDLSREYSSSRDEDILDQVILNNIKMLEKDIHKNQGVKRVFGCPERPLLLSVRGGSVFSMPGILTTVLFVGMNDSIASTMASEDPWHAYDSYRRFLASFGLAVWGVDVEEYNLVENAKQNYNVKYKHALPWEAMRDIVEATKEAIRNRGFGDFLDQALDDPHHQLKASVRAVIDSWNQETAVRYRALKNICDAWHTAVIVQEMVMGNRQNKEVRKGMDETKASLTGVIPRTVVTEMGTRECTGDFKFSASGDDLVGGLTRSASFLSLEKLSSYMPMLNRRLRHTAARLTRFMGADQEIEFTVDRGVLNILQTRAAETGSNKESFGFQEPGPEIARGIGIRGTAFRGLAAFDDNDCQELSSAELAEKKGADGILLILENPTPADIPMLLSADGLLASKGGSTSHAAIAINSVEQKDFYGVLSAEGLRVNAEKHEAVVQDAQGKIVAHIRKGDVVSIHGTTGEVFLGSQPLMQS